MTPNMLVVGMDGLPTGNEPQKWYEIGFKNGISGALITHPESSRQIRQNVLKSYSVFLALAASI